MDKIQIAEFRSILREEFHNIIEEFNLLKSDDVLLPPEEAAQKLKTQPHIMAVWRTEGKGPAPTKIGSRVFYLRSELDRYIQENTLPRGRADHAR